MRALTKHEVAAMWLFHDEYVEQAKGAIEFHAGLSSSNKRLIDDMLEQLNEADQDDLEQRVAELELQMRMLVDPTGSKP